MDRAEEDEDKLAVLWNERHKLVPLPLGAVLSLAIIMMLDDVPPEAVRFAIVLSLVSGVLLPVLCGWITLRATDRPRFPAKDLPHRATRVLSILDRFVPSRVSDEEVGDALELVDQMHRDRRPLWRVYLKVIATIFWVLVHAAQERVRGMLKRTGG